MSGKTCLVTGATSGIGKETAVRLAGEGATLIVPARTAARGEAAADEIRRRVPGARVETLAADLSSMAEVRLLAEQVQARYDRLDVLVNNAGVIMMRRRTTADGWESTLAINHLTPFLLTNLLRGLLERSAPARVVTVASAAHKQVRTMPWDELSAGMPTDQRQAYPLSKLLNILFTFELARRLDGTGVTANCLHPGSVRSGLGRDVTGVLGALLQVALRVQRGPSSGARTSVYLASSPDVADVTGGYFVKSRLVEPSALARDEKAAARLWTLSEELTGLNQNGDG
ncbi:SDR family oxidoreductase [Actinomadura syzygii]|uniref:SDR family oxidoreductase n=1 Tax=Actinomadura syzygii TaxID=1427538 RepID=A0A5D0TW52_9ACTN|nr:SDR family oxidoreductase [Actinomadura syzygii]TYC10087.1 SDR family oxidoreductase [Actinomadura syzygii]